MAYLIAKRSYRPEEIAVFMFNRTAAAEVNERIAAVKVDGETILELTGRSSISIASTFHKFALDLAKLAGTSPDIISESDHNQLVRRAFVYTLEQSRERLPKSERAELLKLTHSFIARAGQQFIGPDGLENLRLAIEEYAMHHVGDADFSRKIALHYLMLEIYARYLSALRPPKTSFNLLMSNAATLLDSAARTSPVYRRVSAFRYLMVDEYQDFSFLFYNLIRSLRHLCPDAHHFCVGDDWQAINRFAGSDVDYFLNFATYFPEDSVNIPLMTNYRSDRRIVEHANHFMLTYYDQQAQPAQAFSSKNGKITYLDPQKTRFNATDLFEDGLGDARYQKVLAADRLDPSSKNVVAAARLLKTVVKIIKKHRGQSILLLHRHNFTSFPDITLADFMAALQQILLDDRILEPAQLERDLRCMTMHKSKGLESDVVILLELDQDIVFAEHPYATLFEIFHDCSAIERADQQRLLYVALTRAKHDLYIPTHTLHF